MDFKHVNDKSDKHMTPKSEINIFSKRISHGVSCDSPFASMPTFSTPPSRFAKILNPFEPHLIERLHLPTFSPNVFVQNSTPKTEQKFKWTIEDISSLKPAEIDETTVSQHICTTDDPQVDHIVQKKIETFFREKVIVPSPINPRNNDVPLTKDCSVMEAETPPKAYSKQTCEGSSQTILTLPPVLPKDVEEALKPYFNFNEDQQSDNDNLRDTSLYQQLFEFDENAQSGPNSPGDFHSIQSSPALSTGLSPIELSPACANNLSSPFHLPDECNLSPISKSSPTKRLSRSICRLDFSERMSIDASLLVPDMDNQNVTKSFCGNDTSLSPTRAAEITAHESTINWSMEYKQVSFGSPSSGSDCDRMDVSNANTPHSKLFTGQRKRLSESFKTDELEENKENMHPFENTSVQNKHKLFRNDLTDAGYHTQEAGDFSNHYSNIFASTPSKRKYNV